MWLWQGEKLLKEPGQCLRLNQATVRADMHGDTHNVHDEQYRVTEGGGERKQGKEKVKAELDRG